MDIKDRLTGGGGGGGHPNTIVLLYIADYNQKNLKRALAWKVRGRDFYTMHTCMERKLG